MSKKSPDFRAEKKRRILSRLWLSWFFSVLININKFGDCSWTGQVAKLVFFFWGGVHSICRRKTPNIGIPIAWYEAQIRGFPRKSIREGASSLFGQGPESPRIVSCSRATPDLHRCNLGVALEQETIFGLSGPCPKRLLAPSLIDFRGNPRIWASYQAVGIPNLT